MAHHLVWPSYGDNNITIARDPDQELRKTALIPL
jgi:hypothetical protein